MDYNYFPTATNPYQFLPALASAPSGGTNNAGVPSDEYNREPPAYEQYSQFAYGGAEASALDHKTASQDILDLNATNSLIDLEQDLHQTNRSSSEEKDNLTPAQSRRKAQNRAAQRAFRERKERHVKELEERLSSIQRTSIGLASENQRLKREIHRISTENTILKATKNQPPQELSVTHVNYNPQEFYKDVLHAHPDKISSRPAAGSGKVGERKVGAGAAWDIIQDHPLFRQGLLDVGSVCQRLKSKVTCDGKGPVFDEKDLRNAIEASASASNDELI